MEDPTNNKKEQDKKINLTFYKDGYAVASMHITDFKNLTPLFKGIQNQYNAVGQLIQSFAKRAQLENNSVVCAKGCKWCCYQPVYLTTQEALLINEYLLQTFDSSKINSLQSKAQKKLKITKDLSEEKKQIINHPCPFLFENACSIYPVRPMACRIYLSSNVDSCKRKYHSPGTKNDFPALFDFILKAGRYMNEGFVGFLKGKGKEIEELTIEAFVIKLHNNPNYYQTWLKEDNFTQTNKNQ